MPRVIWTSRAVGSVARLRSFLAGKDRDAAKRALAAIRRAKALGTHPGIGRPIDDLPPEFREWFLRFGDSGYVILYRRWRSTILP